MDRLNLPPRGFSKRIDHGRRLVHGARDDFANRRKRSVLRKRATAIGYELLEVEHDSPPLERF